VNAALTGHMVYSTLHTNDAPGAVTRMVDIGVKPFLVSAALRAVLAQRLVRRICSACKDVDTPDPKHLQILGLTEEQTKDATFARGRGCPVCNGSGYKGRFGIFEMFTVTEDIGQMIYENRTLVEIRQKARELGMRNMREDGIRKVLAGMTTFDEVLHATVNDPS
jgi:type IV pilus assembly protein PilB